jgi:predicted hydrocarbon binding protein
VIILDESKLTNGTLAMIGQDYGMKISSATNVEAYEEFIDDVVERFKFDIDDFKERLVSAIMNGIKIELKLK